jgi:hypothetical protein
MRLDVLRFFVLVSSPRSDIQPLPLECFRRYGDRRTSGVAHRGRANRIILTVHIDLSRSGFLMEITHGFYEVESHIRKILAVVILGYHQIVAQQ